MTNANNTAPRASAPKAKTQAGGIELPAHSHAMSKDKFKALLGEVKTSGKKLQNDIHTLLMSALAYSAPKDQGGDANATPFLQVLNALPSAVRKSDVRSWLERHSNAVIDVKDGGKTLAISLVPADKRKAVNFDKANAHPFYEEVEAKSNQELAFDDKSFAAMLAKLVKRADAASSAGKLTLSPVNQARLDALKGMVAPTPTPSNSGNSAGTVADLDKAAKREEQAEAKAA